MRFEVASLLLLCSCQTTGRPETPLGFLVRAEKHLERQEADQAVALLESIDEESFGGVDRERYKYDLARGYFAQKEYYDCYEVLKDFVRKHPASTYYSRVEELVFHAGANLAASGWSFLGIASDMSDARRVLEHFLVAHPKSVFVPEALRILGEAAYQDDELETAIDRFTELLEKSPESQWKDLARFRIAMSRFKLLIGPDYDAGALEEAHKELADYLRSNSTNPDFVTQAARALATTDFWIQDKDLRIARFYLRIGKPFGARLHLQRILAKTDAYYREEALALMEDVRRMERQAVPEGAGPTSRAGGKRGDR
ncbi:MAG: outer membrane protein assembly factor BamD [Planctomycetota bacterium]